MFDINAEFILAPINSTEKFSILDLYFRQFINSDEWYFGSIYISSTPPIPDIQILDQLFESKRILIRKDNIYEQL